MYRAFDLTVTIQEIGNIVEHNDSQQIKMGKNIGLQCSQDFDDKYRELYKQWYGKWDRINERYICKKSL